MELTIKFKFNNEQQLCICLFYIKTSDLFNSVWIKRLNTVETIKSFNDILFVNINLASSVTYL